MPGGGRPFQPPTSKNMYSPNLPKSRQWVVSSLGSVHHFIQQSQQRRPALAVGARVVAQGFDAVAVGFGVAEAVLDARIDLEVPVGAGGVHFLLEGGDLLARDERVGVAVADEEAGADR